MGRPKAGVLFAYSTKHVKPDAGIRGRTGFCGFSP